MTMSHAAAYADSHADTFFSSNPLGLVHVDRFGRIRDDNHALLDIFSYVREDVAETGGAQ